MKSLLILSVLSAALLTSACVTVIDASDSDDLAWHGENAQPFDAAAPNAAPRPARAFAATPFAVVWPARAGREARA